MNNDYNTDRKLYFEIIGGFPPAKILKELNDYNGEERICVACTQLDSHHRYFGRSKSDLKRILDDWIDFFITDTNALKALHFNSHVPQRLFDAACCQENLEELRFKWGSYSDLTELKNLRNLKFLYIGSGASVKDIAALGQLESLIVLHIENFKKIEDYSPLTTLKNLEQLVILGPMYGRTPMQDLEFLRKMPNLRSILFSSITLRKKYTSEERVQLRAALPNLLDIGGFIVKR